MFWQNLSPEGGDKPEGELAAAIDDAFGSFDKFRDHFSANANSIQGSGWSILAWDSIGQRLLIVQLYDQQGNIPIGLTPLLMLDMWEHAFYLRVPEREGRLRQGVLEHRELGRRAGSLRTGHAPRRQV